MNRGFACVLLLLAPLVLAGGQEVAPPSVSVDSVPLGARIVLDGQLTGFRTPALLRGLPPGRHTLSLWKEGFIQTTQSFSVAEGKVPILKVSLPPESVVLSFPVNDQIISAQGTLPAGGRQFRFPTGTYFLSGSEEAVRMTPVFDDAALLDTSGWTLGLTTAGLAASVTHDFLLWRVGLSDQPTRLTVALASVALGELAWYLTLQSRKARFYRETSPSITPLPQKLDQASGLYRQGESALENGDLATAEDSFRQFVRAYPDSRWVPGAWFRLAKIHSVTGRRDLALGEYRLVAETFPQPEYHDRSRQALADLNEAAGFPQDALEQVERMVLTDGFFDKETVAAQKTRLLQALETPVSPEAAEPATETPTPRQGYDRTLALFGRGHPFTAEEIKGFDALKAGLIERGDDDLASDLDLVLTALGAASAAAENADGEASRTRAADAQNQRNWRGLRDAGLGLFRISSLTAIGSAAVSWRAPDLTLWTMAGAMGAMTVGLFPMLWGEPRQ